MLLIPIHRLQVHSKEDFNISFSMRRGIDFATELPPFQGKPVSFLVVLDFVLISFFILPDLSVVFFPLLLHTLLISFHYFLVLL